MKEQNKFEEFTPDIVTVIHTFGRDLKWNPHVHMLVTEGGKGKKTEWRHIKFFSYEMLRKRWQKLLLDELSILIEDKNELRILKNKLYQNNKDGFYVHAKSAKIAAKYVGRYVGRPAIAESRILGYDGQFVTYKYTRHEDNRVIIEKVHVYEFIKKIIIHIPEKNFKMVRYFGIYSRRSKGKNNFIKTIDEKILKLRRSLAKWEYSSENNKVGGLLMKSEEILYICTVCKTKEHIPKEVVEYFDEMNQSNINELPCFSWEKCGGIMRPKEYTGVYGIKY